MANSIFTLFAEILLDSKKYDKGIDDAKGKINSLGSSVTSAVGTVGKLTVGAVTAGATAVGALTKSAVSSYAEYEQLAGGIDKLFGKGSKSVMKNVKAAYKTAGMSANEYMKNVTGFSAALINSLENDTEEAARVADMAMRDISDNANTYGKYSAQELANVYQSLAKGQYQTLDNLQLGYGGTKEGLQALIDKANELGMENGKNADLSIDKFADIVEAIHRVQVATHIAGTTEHEAHTTIQGSLTQTKAAWENLKIGLADKDADLKGLIKDFVDSAAQAAENVVPVIEQTLEGIGTLISEVAPIVEEKLPGLIETLAPSLIRAGTSLVVALIKALPGIIQVLVDELPNSLSVIWQAIKDEWPNIEAAINEIINKVPGKFDEIKGKIEEKWPEISAKITEFLNSDTGQILEIIGATWAGIEAFQIVSNVTEAITTIKTLITGAGGLKAAIMGISNPVALIAGLVTAAAILIILNWDKIKKAWGQAKEFFTGVWQDITEAFADAKEWLSNKFSEAYKGVKNAWKDTKQFFNGKWSDIKSCFSTIQVWFGEKFTSAKNNSVSAWSDIKSKFEEKKNEIKNAFANLPGELLQIGSEMIGGLWQGVTEKWDEFKADLEARLAGLPKPLKKVLHIDSPSKVFAEIGEYMALGLDVGFSRTMQDVSDNMQRITKDAIPTLDVPASSSYSHYGYGGSFGDIIINIDGSGLSVEEISEKLGIEVRKQLRMGGALA